MGKFGKILGVAGAVAGAAYLSNSENREKVKKHWESTIHKINPAYLKNLAKPKDMEDAKMVDEGAMTSVQYYNETQEDSDKE